jgi:hypothetical protein
MSTNQQPALPPIGGTMELAGNLFAVASHTTDAKNRTIAIPGKWLGKVKPNKQAEQSVVATPTLPTVSALTTPGLPLTSAPRPKARRARAAKGGYQRFQRKPPPLNIVYEPTPIASKLVTLAIVVVIGAIIWLMSAGSEARKWDAISGAAKAIQRR